MTMPVNELISRVQKLIAFAESDIAESATDEERAGTLREQSLARERADKLMAEYRVTQAMLDMAKPTEERRKPGVLLVHMAGQGQLAGYIASLLQRIAVHCNVKLRLYDTYDREAACYVSKLAGYESDLKYAEMLYTTLSLHMLEVLAPKYEPSLSLEDNAYRLHTAGYNWLEIARMMGYKKLNVWDKDWTNEVTIPYRSPTGNIVPSSKIGSAVKRAYYRAVAARGEEPQKISAGGSGTYRTCVVHGYVAGISERMTKIESGRKMEPGTELALKVSEEDLQNFWEELNPDLFPSAEELERRRQLAAANSAPEQTKGKPRRGRPRTTWKSPPWDSRAAAIGRQQAQTADLTGSTHRRTKEVGS